MTDSHIALSVPALPSFARSVRMMAANLAVLCPMSVEEVEDARMAAEEAFVYVCATKPGTCNIDFCVSSDALSMSFSLGSHNAADDPKLAEQIGLAELLLSAVSDSYEVASDGTSLCVTKLAGGANGH